MPKRRKKNKMLLFCYFAFYNVTFFLVSTVDHLRAWWHYLRIALQEVIQ